MGLMDVLRGMQYGPRWQPAPGGAGAGSGMSPITMAILGLLAYKAIRSFGGQADAPSGAGQPAHPPRGDNVNVDTSAASGGLGDLLRGGLGGLLAGGTAGSVLSGGLNDLIKQLQQHGLGDAANSWIGTGPNKTVTPDDLGRALGADQINALMAQTGLSREELLDGLSQHLPKVVDQLTPEGQVPHRIPI